MGGTKRYQEAGGFDYQTFEQIGTTSNGIKIIKEIGGNSTTPMYSNTPYTMYASIDSRSQMIEKISVYRSEKGRRKIKDIDLGHEHTNPDGRYFPADEIHVQIYDSNGIRSNIARRPSKKEKRIFMMAFYGRK